MKVSVERWFNGYKHVAILTHDAVFGKHKVTRRMEADSEKELLFKITGYIQELNNRMLQPSTNIFEVYEVTASGWSLRK